MPVIGRRIRRLVAAPFVTFSGETVLTLLRSSLAMGGLTPLSSYLVSCSPRDLDVQAHNALSVGIAHVACSASAMHNAAETTSRYRAIPIREGHYLIEVALITRIATELHPPGPDCFESYELLPGGELLTPDLVIAGEHSNEMICAYSRQLPDAQYEEPTSVRVACSGRPGDRDWAEYPLSPRNQ